MDIGEERSLGEARGETIFIKNGLRDGPTYKSSTLSSIASLKQEEEEATSCFPITTAQ